MSIKKILIIGLLCVVVNIRGAVHDSIHETVAQTINLPAEIVKAFEAGDAKVISNYFNSPVELIFSESQNVYAKAQAEQILKNFFNNNASANRKFNYKHLHGTDRDNAQFFIGELHTGKGIYRVNIYMKDQRIHILRIESDD